MDVSHHKTPTKRSVSGSPSVDEEEEAEDAEVWDQFNRRFREVQAVLDRNRALIQQVNDNHRSRVADNMVKVVSLYSDLSSNFSTFFHHRNDNANAKPTN
ncbi:unnamed protein product [Prunus armeniaca]|nr:unnamed protein product [Prunus armeniaca]